MSELVLFVSDEEHILTAAGRLFAESGLTILKAATPRDAMEIFRTNEIAVIVADDQLPGMQGMELLGRVEALVPNTIKVLMTDSAEMAKDIATINSSKVFRVIVKPWEDGVLLETVRDAVSRYKVARSLRNADEAMLSSLAQAIEIKDPFTKGHCDRVARYSMMMVKALGIPADDALQIKYGSWLHDCGKIGVPEAILNHEGLLNNVAFASIKSHPLWGADVARQAHLSEVVVNIIHYHHERHDGTGYPSGLAGCSIPLEARIVAVADVYDALTTDRPYRKAYPKGKAANLMMAMKGNSLDGGMVDVLFDCFSREGG